MREHSIAKLVYCDNVSKPKQACYETNEPNNEEKEWVRKQEKKKERKKHPDHLLFIAIRFYKSGSLLWFSEERKYSYWNVYSTLPPQQELFM